MTNKTRIILFIFTITFSLLLTWAVSAAIDTVRQLPVREETSK